MFKVSLIHVGSKYLRPAPFEAKSASEFSGNYDFVT